jgi:hypothetical protein
VFLQHDALIAHERILPYAFVIPVLARFFALFPKLSSRNAALLRRWVWRGALGGVGAGPTAVLRRAVQAVGESEDESVQRLLALIGKPSSYPIDMQATQLNRAAARANVSLMASMGPRDLDTGERIDVGRLFDTPGEGLVRVADPADPRQQSLATLFVHPTPGDDDLTGLLLSSEPKVAQSHVVSTTAIELLRSGDLSGFLREREHDLAVALASRADALVELHGSDRPSLSSLVVGDS